MLVYIHHMQDHGAGMPRLGNLHVCTRILGKEHFNNLPVTRRLCQLQCSLLLVVHGSGISPCLQQSLCNRSMNVKKLLEQKSTVGLTAVCDLLVTMILAMDAFQRENNKPAVAASNEDSQHSVMPQHEDTVKGEVRLKKEKARTTTAKTNKEFALVSEKTNKTRWN